MNMFGIWDMTTKTWLRESGSKAILVWEYRKDAEARAATNWGFDTFAQAAEALWCDVFPICAVLNTSPTEKQ
jgi:hypothetical protein